VSSEGREKGKDMRVRKTRQREDAMEETERKQEKGKDKYGERVGEHE
jgi:hypothetical protein